MARPRSEEARAKMLDAAVCIITDEGVRGFSVDAVARRSGVAKTTIYRHFCSGEELMMRALDCVIVPFPSPDTGSLRGDILEFVSTILPAVADPALRPTMLDILAESARNPKLAVVHQAMIGERAVPLRQIYERGRERGEIDPDIDFDAAFAMIEGPFVAQWLVRPERLTDIDVEATVDMVVRALKG